MEQTPTGTPVGVDDPYDHAGRCDHLTSDGHCRLAREYADRDPAFARERARVGYECVAADEDCDFRDCPHYASTTSGRECTRCGLEEVRMAHDSTARPLLEEHHLSYGSRTGDKPSHEITVALCRWCHTKVHKSFARTDDDASPDPEAIAAREARRTKELEEMGFQSARDRFGDG
ncbi:hypothetical protein GJR96_02115 [Haloferax sp. MBLA0076]|uniref:Uncharacterized protein n=1 Tax=Haloferax litoreum TaxID=2666140 RepID=A0A6A8GD60_9EURY|nr:MULTISPECIES: hypothetical protein [Haloferax]KAB1192301.1 hypothetical protein Hfx1148_02105 [Haloferax sp. CBA1148]MRX20759.1 hypothetical protein [Haloferax litoreum]